MERTAEACDLFIDYLFGELTETQMEHFQGHMEKCAYCKAQFAELWPIHKQLLVHEGPEDRDLPSLEDKTRVLNHAFAARKPGQFSPVAPSRRQWFSFVGMRNRRRLLLSSALAVCLLVVGVTVTDVAVTHPQTQATSPTEQLVFSPAASYPQAQGAALMVQHAGWVKLVVHVAHVPLQTKSGCYDVWGVTNGQRYSLGEFTVNPNGSGTLNIDTKRHFDKLEITLEPNWGDKAPLGPQVLQGQAVHV